MKRRAPWWFTAAIVVIVLVAVGLRLYHLTYPIADWHSFRQVDTAAVARYFVKFGMNPLKPRYEDMSNIQSGKDNPMGYRMVEFPIYQIIAVGLSHLSGGVPLDIWLRITSILAATGTAVMLTFFMTALAGPLTGIFTGAVYAVLPYSMYYGRVTLPEPLAVFFAVASLYCLVSLPDRSEEKRSRDTWVFVASIVSSALAVLVKPTVGFLLVPIPYLLYKKYGLSVSFVVRSIVFGVLALVPFYLWRQWILHFPEGIPASDWLFNKGDIRFKGAWFYWLFSQRIGSLILGYWGLIPFGIGLMIPTDKKEGWTLRLLLLGSLSYLIVFASGNVQHDYYQIILLPILCMYVGKGITYMLTNRLFSRPMAFITTVVCLAFACAFSWYTIHTYYWINRPEIIEAGKVADSILPKDAKVIAPYNGDTTFLYATNRQGWPEGFDIDKKIAMGAGAYVTVSPKDDDWETKTLAEQYTVLVRNDKFAIIDLTKPKKLIKSK